MGVDAAALDEGKMDGNSDGKLEGSIEGGVDAVFRNDGASDSLVGALVMGGSVGASVCVCTGGAVVAGEFDVGILVGPDPAVGPIEGATERAREGMAVGILMAAMEGSTEKEGNKEGISVGMCTGAIVGAFVSGTGVVGTRVIGEVVGKQSSLGGGGGGGGG